MNNRLPPQHCPEHSQYTSSCRPCKDAKARWKRHWSKLREMGWSPRIPARGTARRIQALMCLGYGPQYLAERLGMQRVNVYRLLDEEMVWRPTAERVAALFEELQDTPAPETPWSKAVKTRAAKRGYAPPAAWDDIDEDHAPYDPDADIEIDDADEYARLRYLGLQDWEIAKRFGIAEESLQRRLYRAA